MACEDPESVKEQLRIIRRDFLLYVVGCFVLYSAYGTLLNLQSSFNVVDGLGTIALAVTYSVAVVFCLTFSPLIIRKVGPKKSLWISECSHLIYILSNFYPRFYTMIPAAVLLGIGDCVFWICLPLMNAFFAKSYSKVRNHHEKDDAYYVTSFSGYYFTIFQCQKIFGNFVSYVALYAFSKPSSENITLGLAANASAHLSTNTSGVLLNPAEDAYRFCGANDCQDAEVVSENLDQYQPVPAALYALMGILSAMALVAILMHAFLIPDGRLETIVRYEIEKFPNDPEDSDKNGDGALDYDVVAVVKSGCVYDSNSNPVLYGEKLDENPPLKAESGGLIFVKRLLLDVLGQLLTPKQVLLVPLILYAGMHYGFGFSELTRAYTSCVIGVSWVPIHVAVFGVGAVAVSYISGKFGSKIGVGGFLSTSFVLDIASYIFIIIWTPSPETAWALFLVYFAFGISQAMWISQTMVTQVLYFSSNPEIACSLWTAVYMAGMSIQYWWSTWVCVRHKIYIQAAIVGTGMLCYGILRKSQAMTKRSPEKSVSKLQTPET